MGFYPHRPNHERVLPFLRLKDKLLTGNDLAPGRKRQYLIVRKRMFQSVMQLIHQIYNRCCVHVNVSLKYVLQPSMFLTGPAHSCFPWPMGRSVNACKHAKHHYGTQSYQTNRRYNLRTGKKPGFCPSVVYQRLCHASGCPFRDLFGIFLRCCSKDWLPMSPPVIRIGMRKGPSLTYSGYVKP